ncbi:hypothetical protein FRC09_020173 [Ceratobasidium sp. 395]|nr:hypothetical protein FRC09_020173 [Ceratobasidium sp. 395]
MGSSKRVRSRLVTNPSSLFPHTTNHLVFEIPPICENIVSRLESLRKYLTKRRVGAENRSPSSPSLTSCLCFEVVHLSDAELTALGFLGPAAVQQVIEFIAVVKKSPEQFEWVTVFQLQCFHAHWNFHPNVPAFQRLPASSEVTLPSHHSEPTATEPDLVSAFERVHFYTGISEDHPLLLQRSDLQTRPFIIPKGRFSSIPEKTVHGVVHPILSNKFWKETVAPEIIALLKDQSRGVRVSTMSTVRFSTLDENGQDVFDKHIVLWISVHPNTTKETACRDANADILAILARHGIEDAAVHWIEGAAESLGGPPPMMRVVRDTNPTHYIRRALTAVLGTSLAADRLADNDVQGSLGLYFHEGKTPNGQESTRVLALTNKHVTSKITTRDYNYGERSGVPRQYIRNCSRRRFEQVVNETRELIAKQLGDAGFLAEQLAEILAKPVSVDEGEAADDKLALERKQEYFKWAAVDVGRLSDFFQLVNSTWSDPYQRIVGWLDWAPKIAKDLDHRRYTRDLAVIALDQAKFAENFKGNFVYLAGKFTPYEITSFFYPNSANPPPFTYPKDHLFRLSGCVDAAGLTNPYFWDDQGNPHFIVAKYGQSTDLTFGRFSELEAYTCDKSGHDSWEVAVFNLNKKHGSFSAQGDSGAAIFNAEGKLVAILHSGMPKGKSNHVTELVKEHYPHANFDRLKFAETAA